MVPKGLDKDAKNLEITRKVIHKAWRKIMLEHSVWTQDDLAGSAGKHRGSIHMGREDNETWVTHIKARQVISKRRGTHEEGEERQLK